MVNASFDSVAGPTDSRRVGDRIQRYILDGRDEDLQRLLRLSQVMAQTARAGLRRAGLQQGWSVIDCGCGPIGALVELAEMTGPGGRVVGVDANDQAVERARLATKELGLDNVEVVVGDLHEVEEDALRGPFDLAFSRLFLAHQPDPVETLRRIASFLRPGGWLVAQEPLRDPAPRSQPPVEALRAYWEIIEQGVERAGVPPGAVEQLPSSARAAGLEIIETNGFFVPIDATVGFELHASTAAAMKERVVRLGVATGHQIDELVDTLRAARDGDYEWVSSPFLLELILRRPVGAAAG